MLHLASAWDLEVLGIKKKPRYCEVSAEGTAEGLLKTVREKLKAQASPIHGKEVVCREKANGCAVIYRFSQG